MKTAEDVIKWLEEKAKELEEKYMFEEARTVEWVVEMLKGECDV